MTEWAALVALAERERALVAEERFEEAAVLARERSERAAALPAPPPDARAELERLAALQSILTAELTTARARIARELAALRRGGSALRGYGATLTPPPARVDGRG